MVFKFTSDIDEQEAYTYRPGQRVELKQRPGVIDIIAEYDPMMVPPISLVNDPLPRYPEELVLISKPVMEVGWLKPGSSRKVRVSAFRSDSRTSQMAGAAK